jgi:hypothetical protein
MSALRSSLSCWREKKGGALASPPFVKADDWMDSKRWPTFPAITIRPEIA